MAFFLRLSLFAASPALAVAEETAPVNSGTSALIVAGLAAIAATTALILALRARRLAEDAAEEAGQARARASQASAGGVTSDALAAAERVWSTRLTALEAQISVPGGTRGVTRAPMAIAPAADVTARIEELERTVSGLAIIVKDLRRPGAGVPIGRSPAGEAAAGANIAWPGVLATDTPAIHDVRQALAQAVKAGDPAVRDLLERLREVERWPKSKPGTAELAAALQEISSLLLAALRRGAAREPLDAALFADRVLAVLRPQWKSFQPHLDCRSMLPGTTLDPDWMEDHTAAGLRRPVISEMLSWAVFEKHDAGRRVLAKARVTTD
jgi:hypothetical protein